MEGQQEDDEKNDRSNNRFPKKGGLKTTGLEDEEDSKEEDDEKTFADSTTGTSTLATAPMTPSNMSYISAKKGKISHKRNIRRQRKALTAEFLMLSVMAGMSMFLFLYFYLPLSALLALGTFASTTSLAIFTLYQRFLLEYDNVVSTRGLGDYLPQSIYTQLAETTLHDWLTDNSFMMEYRYLALYFMGLSQESLDEYIERLPPRHRNVLQRHGLGQVFGNDFMRLLCGDQRWHAPQQEQQQSQLPILPEQTQSSQVRELVSNEPPIRTIESTSRELAFDDENSYLGDATADESMQSQQITISQRQRSNFDETSVARRLPTEVGPTGADDNVDEQQRQRDIEIEDSIFNDAFNSLFRSTYQSTLQNINQVANRAAGYISPLLIRGGLSLATISAGVGILGVWYGVYDPSAWRLAMTGTSSSSTAHRFPSSRSVLSSLFIGGGTTGIGFLFRRVGRDNNASGGTKHPKDGKKTQKKN